ncbi:MAG: type I methionyl aminopeptidase [Alphaproteobacteria bacterium]|nr:type I methionyl aminopeptidase [Rickettsiales bacterium]
MSNKIQIHKKSDFDGMRKAGRLAAEVLQYIEPMVVSGVTTLELNDLCHSFIVARNAIPAPLNYKGFSKSICTSVNNVVCHGIPSETQKLWDGDIINIDITVIVDGWHGDTSKTFFVGNLPKKISPKVRKIIKLVDVAKEAMFKGIEVVKPKAKLSDIGKAIESYVLPFNFSIVQDYCGHGIGRVFHDAPSVLHYNASDFDFYDVELEEGMFFTIEPMINIGSFSTVLSNLDGWTVFTRDGCLSAQFEHTVGVTSDGVEIFTTLG